MNSNIKTGLISAYFVIGFSLPSINTFGGSIATSPLPTILDKVWFGLR